MKIREFKALRTEEKVKMVNNRLHELKFAKLGFDNFKTEELDFNFDNAMKDLYEVGYILEGYTFKKEAHLTVEEVERLKEIAEQTVLKKLIQ